MQIDNFFKAHVQELRQQANLSQKEIAEKVGISELAYQRYEYGTRVPEARTAIRIAQALGTTVEKLWGGNPT